MRFAHPCSSPISCVCVPLVFFHQKNPDEETNQQVADVKRGLELLKIRSEDGERPGGKTFPGPDPPMVATGLSLLMEVVETDDSRGK